MVCQCRSLSQSFFLFLYKRDCHCSHSLSTLQWATLISKCCKRRHAFWFFFSTGFSQSRTERRFGAFFGSICSNCRIPVRSAWVDLALPSNEPSPPRLATHLTIMERAFCLKFEVSSVQQEIVPFFTIFRYLF